MKIAFKLNWYILLVPIVLVGVLLISYASPKRVKILKEPLSCNPRVQVMLGKSKCFDCDTEIANTYCNSSSKIQDSYISRLGINEVDSTGNQPAPKLGRM